MITPLLFTSCRRSLRRLSFTKACKALHDLAPGCFLDVFSSPSYTHSPHSTCSIILSVFQTHLAHFYLRAFAYAALPGCSSLPPLSVRMSPPLRPSLVTLSRIVVCPSYPGSLSVSPTRMSTPGGLGLWFVYCSTPQDLEQRLTYSQSSINICGRKEREGEGGRYGGREEGRRTIKKNKISQFRSLR